jgi:DDE_Tnp_1-associated
MAAARPKGGNREGPPPQGVAKSWPMVTWVVCDTPVWAGSRTGTAPKVIMAVPTPARSPPRGQARYTIILDRPCHWPVADRRAVPDGERARLLPVLAAIPDPRARRGVRHRLAVILGLALCAGMAGARSFTAIAE